MAAAPVVVQTPVDISAATKAAHDRCKDLKEGANGDSIPALAKLERIASDQSPISAFIDSI